MILKMKGEQFPKLVTINNKRANDHMLVFKRCFFGDLNEKECNVNENITDTDVDTISHYLNYFETIVRPGSDAAPLMCRT